VKKRELRIEIECLRDALEMHRKAERHRAGADWIEQSREAWNTGAANVSPDSVTELEMARVDLGVAHTTIEDLTLDIERYRDILRMHRKERATSRKGTTLVETRRATGRSARGDRTAQSPNPCHCERSIKRSH